MSSELIFALVCAVAAIAYGAVSIGWIMAKPSGNDRMREIAGERLEAAMRAAIAVAYGRS